MWLLLPYYVYRQHHGGQCWSLVLLSSVISATHLIINVLGLHMSVQKFQHL